LPPGISSILFKGLNRFPGSFYTSQSNKDTLKELVLANNPTIADIEAIPESVLMLEISSGNFLQPEHISRLPPRLTTLFRVIPEYKDYPEDPEMFAKEFSGLPRSLKSLQLRRFLRHNNTPGIICQGMSSSSLPRSLTTLKLMTVTRLEADWMRGLPRTLTEMVLHSTEWSREHSESLKISLPRLLSLRLTISFSSKMQQQPFCDLLNMLPPSLTSFELDNLDDEMGNDEDDDDDDEEEKFPRHLPPGLLHLSLPFSMGICPEMAHLLPKSLVSLYLEGRAQENWLLPNFFKRS
jgi:hypothetical protein